MPGYKCPMSIKWCSDNSLTTQWSVVFSGHLLLSAQFLRTLDRICKKSTRSSRVEWSQAVQCSGKEILESFKITSSLTFSTLADLHLTCDSLVYSHTAISLCTLLVWICVIPTKAHPHGLLNKRGPYNDNARMLMLCRYNAHYLVLEYYHANVC